jgi:hypothetical protein
MVAHAMALVGQKGKGTPPYAKRSRTSGAIYRPSSRLSVYPSDAAGHIDNIMQHAARMAAYYAPAAAGQPKNVNESVEQYLKWTEVVLVTAGKLIPYQRPTYRSVEVRDGREHDQRRRIFDNPREELGRMIVGAVLAVQAKTAEPVEPKPVEPDEPTPPAVDNGDGVIS